ncbi:MAG: TetR/AcrR family transcriptional regulator, partial [Myxococcota bacterium]|nr:TetR/AcrR family transcriptional regulator [Myxococcota bacterium]
HSARVSDIAREAGVADGTIYRYFESKEQVLLTIFEEKMEEHLVMLSERIDGLDCPMDRLEAFARHHFEQLRRHPDLAQVFQVELRQSHRFLKDYRPEKLWQYIGVLQTLVEEGRRRGLVREDVDPVMASWSYFGALDELAIQWVLARNRERFNLDKAAEQVASFFIRGMAA